MKSVLSSDVKDAKFDRAVSTEKYSAVMLKYSDIQNLRCSKT